ncbi:hypothetical protein F2P81_018624 [Scophthalmus maximus]|uniref:Uncharacterized protein n=1 Tax=Scophthalmus maximus TaxID=52904 RepID=A0A6A4SA97_SCOMX|nr:hypothetical protein F2P81_018624 [Scophthalmus maximus]
MWMLFWRKEKFASPCCRPAHSPSSWRRKPPQGNGVDLQPPDRSDIAGELPYIQAYGFRRGDTDLISHVACLHRCRKANRCDASLTYLPAAVIAHSYSCALCSHCPISYFRREIYFHTLKSYGVVSGCAKEPEPSSGRSLLRLQGTLPPLLSSQITVISVITDHSDVDAAGPRIAFLFKVQGEEITGCEDVLNCNTKVIGLSAGDSGSQFAVLCFLGNPAPKFLTANELFSSDMQQ